MAKRYFQLIEKLQSVKDVSVVGNTDVLRCGIGSLDEIVGFKKGFPVFIGGAPHHGKTEIGLEFMINLSIEKGFKWFCYLGEGGSVEQVFLELMHKYLQKPYSFATESEKVQAEYFVNECFVVANDDLDFMITGFYAAVQEAELELAIKFDGTFFDPFNDIQEELEKFNGREDKFLAYALKQVRIEAKKYNRIDFVVTHIADVKAIQDRETQKFYLRAAMANEWAGGRTWWRRAFLMLLVYRPPVFLKDENDKNYEENETHIYCQKAKPKGIAKLGRASIFWDWKKNRYYWKDILGNIIYHGGKVVTPVAEDVKLPPNLNFHEEKKTVDENPF
jgi:hypothetical protein